MTTLHLDPWVTQAYPEVSIAAVTAQGLAGADSWPVAENALAELEKDTAGGTRAPVTETDPAIAAWHAVYRRFGTNPRRMRPSIDALNRRLTRTGQLPRINGAVDAYNAISVRHGIPAGAFDLGAVQGDLQLRVARNDDEFTPLGEPGVIERPNPGEIVYADDSSVLTRHWNYRDAERTKVTAESKNVIFLLETAHGPAGLPGLDAAAHELAGLVAAFAYRVTVAVLTPGGTTSATVGAEG